MSERKKLNTEKDIEEMNALLEKVVSFSRSTEDVHEMAPFVSTALQKMKNMQTFQISLQIVTEILAIFAPKSILAPDEVDFVFEKLLVALQTTVLDLERFVLLRVPALLKNSMIIRKFFDSFQTAKMNLNFYEDILGIFIEESEDNKEMVDRMAVHRPFPIRVFRRAISKIDVFDLDEDVYTALYINYNEGRDSRDDSIEFRYVSGRFKLRFVESSVVYHKDLVYQTYINDKDRRVRKILARNCSEEGHFAVLMNDPDEDVRIALLEKLHWGDFASKGLLPVHERLLDKNFKVREQALRIYREGALALKESEIFRKGPIRAGGLAFCSGNAAFAEETACFVRFFLALCKGCLTANKAQYLETLRSCEFSFHFLHEHRNSPGVSAFLRTLRIAEYSQIPKDLREFGLKFLYKGPLDHTQIVECIESGNLEVLGWIEQPEKYFEILYRRFKEETKIEALERLGNFLKGQFVQHSCPESAIDVDRWFDSPFVFFLNAHLPMEQSVVEHWYGKVSTSSEPYPVLYFLIHQNQNDKRIPGILSALNPKPDVLVSLLLYFTDPLILLNYLPNIIRANILEETKDRILSSKTFVGSVIYFLVTGMVSNASPHFFFTCLQLCKASSDQSGVDFIIRRYVRILEQCDFDWVYSVATVLSECSCLREREDENANNGVLRLSLEDRMLHFICNKIVMMREGKMVDVKVDVENYGFFRLGHREMEMVRCKRVVYR